MLEGLRIEQAAHFGADGGAAADHFGDVDGLIFGIAGIDALG